MIRPSTSRFQMAEEATEHLQRQRAAANQSSSKSGRETIWSIIFPLITTETTHGFLLTQGRKGTNEHHTRPSILGRPLESWFGHGNMALCMHSTTIEEAEEEEGLVPERSPRLQLQAHLSIHNHYLLMVIPIPQSCDTCIVLFHLRKPDAAASWLMSSNSLPSLRCSLASSASTRNVQFIAEYNQGNYQTQHCRAMSDVS